MEASDPSTPAIGLRVAAGIVYPLRPPDVAEELWDKLGDDAACWDLKDEADAEEDEGGPTCDLLDDILGSHPAECDHEWLLIDDSFDHEFGTEILHHLECQKCGAEKPADARYERPENE